jgi:hypothetical protein
LIYDVLFKFKKNGKEVEFFYFYFMFDNFLQFVEKYVFNLILYTFDSFLHKKINKVSFTGVKIPDIVHFKNGIPVVWYFSSVKNGQILKKVFDIIVFRLFL